MEQTTTETKKRPTFLTVLCILSFVAAGFVIIGGILAYLAMGVVSGMADAVTAGMENVEGMETLAAAADTGMGSIKISLIVGIALSIIGLIGVIMMWKLKKTGFYIYTATQLAGIIAPIILIGMTGFPLWGTIFSVLFIVLYGLNLKHMS